MPLTPEGQERGNWRAHSIPLVATAALVTLAGLIGVALSGLVALAVNPPKAVCYYARIGGQYERPLQCQAISRDWRDSWAAAAGGKIFNRGVSQRFNGRIDRRSGRRGHRRSPAIWRRCSDCKFVYWAEKLDAVDVVTSIAVCHTRVFSGGQALCATAPLNARNPPLVPTFLSNEVSPSRGNKPPLKESSLAAHAGMAPKH